MKLDLYTDTVGKTDSGKWVEFQDGEWREIPEPAWVRIEQIRRRRRAASPEGVRFKMTDPYERTEVDIPMVTVRRVITKTVPEYEAEVLCRNGWEVDPL